RAADAEEEPLLDLVEAGVEAGSVALVAVDDEGEDARPAGEPALRLDEKAEYRLRRVHERVLRLDDVVEGDGVVEAHVEAGRLGLVVGRLGHESGIRGQGSGGGRAASAPMPPRSGLLER